MFGIFEWLFGDRMYKEPDIVKEKKLLMRIEELQRDLDLTESAYFSSIKTQDDLNAEVLQMKQKLEQRDDMLSICRDGRLQAEKDARDTKEALKLATFKLNSATDAIRIFSDRHNISPAELRQLQVADMITPVDGAQGFEKPSASFAPFEATDPLNLLNAGNDFKQTAGKFRQLRQSFVTMQLAITNLFDGLEMQAKKAAVTRDQIRSARDAVSGKIGRKI